MYALELLEHPESRFATVEAVRLNANALKVSGLDNQQPSFQILTIQNECVILWKKVQRLLVEIPLGSSEPK